MLNVILVGIVPTCIRPKRRTANQRRPVWSLDAVARSDTMELRAYYFIRGIEDLTGVLAHIKSQGIKFDKEKIENYPGHRFLAIQKEVGSFEDAKVWLDGVSTMLWETLWKETDAGHTVTGVEEKDSKGEWSGDEHYDEHGDDFGLWDEKREEEKMTMKPDAEEVKGVIIDKKYCEECQYTKEGTEHNACRVCRAKSTAPDNPVNFHTPYHQEGRYAVRKDGHHICIPCSKGLHRDHHKEGRGEKDCKVIIGESDQCMCYLQEEGKIPEVKLIVDYQGDEHIGDMKFIQNCGNSGVYIDRKTGLFYTEKSAHNTFTRCLQLKAMWVKADIEKEREPKDIMIIGRQPNWSGDYFIVYSEINDETIQRQIDGIKSHWQDTKERGAKMMKEVSENGN